jgi:hypothetical protein
VVEIARQRLKRGIHALAVKSILRGLHCSSLSKDTPNQPNQPNGSASPASFPPFPFQSRRAPWSAHLVVRCHAERPGQPRGQAEIFTWTGNVPVYFGGWVGGSVSAPAASKFARLRVTVTPAP